MKQVNVALGKNSYEIHVGSGIMAGLGSWLRASGFGSRVVIITDNTVQTLLADSLGRRLEEEGFTVVDFQVDKLIDELAIQKFADEMDALIRSGVRKVIIDFEGLLHLSSGALGKLISLFNRLKSEGGRLMLTGIRPQIYQVFKITKLDQLFEIYQTVDEALEEAGG